MADELLGYTGNLKPLSITQDATVRAPRALDTRVAVSPTDNGNRDMENVGKLILATSNAISSVGNAFTKVQNHQDKLDAKAKVDKNLQEAKRYSAASDAASNMFTEFNANTTALLAASSTDKPMNYTSRFGDAGVFAEDNFGTMVDGENGKRLVIDRTKPIYEGLTTEQQDKLFTQVNAKSTALITNLGTHSNNQKRTIKKDEVAEALEVKANGALDDGISIKATATGYNDANTDEGLSSIGLNKLKVKDTMYGNATKSLVRIKNNRGALAKFLAINTTEEASDPDNTNYNIMVAQAQSYIDTIDKSRVSGQKAHYKQLVDSGDLTQLLPLLEKSQSDQQLTQSEQNIVNQYVALNMEVNGYVDGEDGSGKRAGLLTLYKDVLNSKDAAQSRLAIQTVANGGTLSVDTYDSISSDQKRRVDSYIEQRVSQDFQSLFLPVNDTETLGEGEITSTDREQAIARLKHYSNFPGNNKFVLDTISTYKAKAMGNVDSTVVAGTLASMWTNMPQEIKQLIPTKEQEDYRFAMFVSQNPTYGARYAEILDNPEGISEAIKNGFSKQDKLKLANAMKESNGYGLEAEKYFNKMYALTRDAEVAEAETIAQFGIQDLGFGDVKISSKIKDRLVGAGIHTNDLSVSFYTNIKKYAKVPEGAKEIEVIDIYGAKSRVSYIKENGAQGVAIVTDKSLNDLIDKVKNDFATNQIRKQQEREQIKNSKVEQFQRMHSAHPYLGSPYMTQ